MSNNQIKYILNFGMDSAKDPDKTRNALHQALDIRKFEIGLYWQRATYFWSLIAVSFAGYFALLASEHMVDKEFYAFVLACIGFIFSLAWFLTNRGSKYWQENWENHVDMLEDNITGPLYKTILHRPLEGNRISRAFIGPAPFSVSQINQWVSLFIVAIWFCLIWLVLPNFNLNSDLSLKHIAVSSLTIIASFLLLGSSNSNIRKGHKHSMVIRRTEIIEE